jgi:hypothetical protein
MRHRHALALLSVVLLPVRLAAQDSSKVNPRAAQPERPTVATHAYTVAPGYLEIESGVEFDRYRLTSDKARNYTMVSKFGLSPRVQFDLILAAQQDGGSLRYPIDCDYGGPCGPISAIPSGVGDPSIAFKFRVANDHPLFGDFAIQTGIKFPVGERKLTTHTTDVSLLFISSRDIGPVHLDLNVGGTFRDGDGSNAPTMSTVWTASFGGSLSGPIGWAAELFGYPATTGLTGAPSSMALLAGPTWAITKSVVLDLGIIHRLAGEQPTATFFGLTANLGRLW